MTLKTVAVTKLRKDFLIRSKSEIPNPNPKPIIGPIRGEISIAPMITAVEFIFKPREATKTAKINTQRLVPLNSTPFRIVSIVSFSSSLSCRISRLRLKNSFI